MKINKRTANKVNRLYNLYEGSKVQIWKNEQKIKELTTKRDEIDMDENFAAYDDIDYKITCLKRENEDLQKKSEKALPQLEGYLGEKRILDSKTFEAHLNEENMEIFSDTCCPFHQTFYDLQNELIFFVNEDAKMVAIHSEDHEQVQTARNNDSLVEVDEHITYIATLQEIAQQIKDAQTPETTTEQSTEEDIQPATYTATITQQMEDHTSNFTTTLPASEFEEMTAEQITDAINDIISTTSITGIKITRWTATDSHSIQFGEDPGQLTQPKAWYMGKTFSDQTGKGPDIIVGQPHPYTGLIVQWPDDKDMVKAEQEAHFLRKLNCSPDGDISDIVGKVSNLKEGDVIRFTWNWKEYKAEFKMAKIDWTGGMMNVKNVQFLDGKTRRYQNNIRLASISDFRVIKQF